MALFGNAIVGQSGGPTAAILSYLVYCMCAQTLDHVQLFETLWTVAYQAPLSMGFSRQEY